MWKSTVGHEDKLKAAGLGAGSAAGAAADDNDDWKTDANFVNDVSEKETRWGSKGVPGSGRDDEKLAKKVISEHEAAVKNEYHSKPNFSTGYGGKFGVPSPVVAAGGAARRGVRSSVPTGPEEAEGGVAGS
ncbi:MAG: hypothetical protein BJ554DRAFT_1101 [Olpidium bornovanus]|uniref:Uncharacterized protein n=1 Tax=Olpidium bornovanus TaxID=278681 RepID=A0A8H7ZSL7_9FUNG|nr:MAG: hypothetical protein BJ554DRAFT_1101 [Olpidium bornovanus]